MSRRESFILALTDLTCDDSVDFMTSFLLFLGNLESDKGVLAA